MSMVPQARVRLLLATSLLSTAAVGVRAQSEITIDDVAVPEGNSGTASAVFTVTLAPAATQTVTVRYQTLPGTATEGSDYDFATALLTFPPGTTTRTIPVTVHGDTTAEPDETFLINLTRAVGASLLGPQGRGTIPNDDTGAPGRTYYVDPTIPVASCTTYNVATRTCTGGTETAYKTIAPAAAVGVGGDTVGVRGGTSRQRRLR